MRDKGKKNEEERLLVSCERVDVSERELLLLCVCVCVCESVACCRVFVRLFSVSVFPKRELEAAAIARASLPPHLVFIVSVSKRHEQHAEGGAAAVAAGVARNVYAY